MGGTLVVSRAVNNHSFYKKQLETLGFPNVRVTSLDRDGLSALIYDMKPDLLIMGARFYQCSTPYMMRGMRRDFPKLNMAALSIGEYPADLAMYFILNGVRSYANAFDDIDEFYKGLDDIRDGKEFVPETVQEQIDARTEYPAGARLLTRITTEVLRCICNGFSKEEIADNLAISPRTVENHRNELYRSLNVRNMAGLLAAALDIGIITRDELVFRHRNFMCTPLAEKEK